MFKILLKIKISISTFILILVLASCEKFIDFEVPDEEQQVVANGLIFNNSGIWVNLSQSNKLFTPFRSTQFNTINNAEIEFYENEQFITNLSYINNGLYREDNFDSQAGNEYKLIIRIPGMSELEATTIIPEPATIISLDTTIARKNTLFRDSLHHYIKVFATLTFEDDPNIDNYYMLGAEYFEGNIYEPIEIESLDPVINRYIDDFLCIVAFDDLAFNGQTKTIDFTFEIAFPMEIDILFIVDLYSITEDYYKYMLSYSKAGENEDDPLFFEPVSIHSNVQGGLGIFAAMSRSTESFNVRFE